MKTEWKLFPGVGYAAMLFSYAWFCISEAFFCTMNYRYISVSMFFPLIGTVVWLQNGQAEGGLEKGNLHRLLKAVLAGGIVCFLALAVIVDLYLIAWSETPL